MTKYRIALGSVGVLLGLFGVFRLLTQIDVGDLELLAVWLIGALVIHDGILSPVVAGVGWALARTLPRRARRYVQPTLVVGALITVIALPMIYREGTQPRSKAILQQNYGGNLALILGILVAGMVVSYLVRVVRDRRRPRPQPGPGARPSPR